MQQPKYRFYATLLDAFSWYQVSESENAEQELIDKINRVPITDPKALERMGKGSALNNLIDSIVLNGYDKFDEVPGITVFDGVEFKTEIVKQIAGQLHGSIAQHKTSTIISVNGIAVEVYGVLDYVIESRCIDLKTTSSYDLGKYKDSMQRHLYPICLFNEGVVVDEFEFLVTDFKSVFKEPYRVDLKESEAVIKNQCQMLIDFIESKKHFIKVF